MLYLSCVKIRELHCPAKTEQKLALGGWHSEKTRWRFYVSFCVKGKTVDSKDTMVDAIPTLKERVRKMDPTTLYSVITDLAKVSPDSNINQNYIV